jgi:hypothetical protein
LSRLGTFTTIDWHPFSISYLASGRTRLTTRTFPEPLPLLWLPVFADFSWHGTGAVMMLNDSVIFNELRIESWMIVSRCWRVIQSKSGADVIKKRSDNNNENGWLDTEFIMETAQAGMRDAIPIPILFLKKGFLIKGS